MILSYKYNYIFIKTRKTGGTTIEMNLAPSCGPEDVITELTGKEEMIRGNGVPLCRNFAAPEIEDQVRAILSENVRSKRKLNKLASRKRRNTFWTHMHASHIKSRIPSEVWDNAFKFTVERHPYEKAVSQAYFRYDPKTGPFEEHLEETVQRGGYTGFQFYTIDSEVVMDEIIRTESLLSDLKRLGEKLGFPVADELISAKTSTRADRRPAAEILTEAQRETVYKFCKKEFELLGYKA